MKEEEEKINLELKKLEAAEKRAMVEDWEKRKLDDIDEKTKLEKIEVLRRLLESSISDDENFIPGTEQRFRPVFREEESWLIKKKLFEIINKL